MTTKLKYSNDQMLAALQSVRNGKSVSAASKIHKVPRSTLWDKYNERVPLVRKMGPDTILSVEEENQLVQWMFEAAKVGFPVTKDQLLDSVKLLAKELKKSSNFKNGRPGRSWYEGFLKRHPEISKRVAQNLTKSRASVTEEVLRGWFNGVWDYFVLKCLTNVLLDGRRIFNCDETAFFLCPKGSYVLVKRGDKTVCNFVNCDEKECITTLMTGNAAGQLAPPMVVFSYKRVPADIAASVPKTWGLGTSDNGWMTGQTFYEYITNVFHPWLLKEKIPLPVVLFLDGNSSHITLSTSQFCLENQIILVALYPNSTHILQPMDVSVFSPLKKEWKKVIQNWRMENGGERLSRKNFAPLLEETIKNCNFSQFLQSGFRTCGLFPYNADAIDYSKLLRPRRPQNLRENIEEIKVHLQFIEQQISADKMALFKSSGNSWSGNVEDQSLFDFWLGLKTKSGAVVADNSMAR